MRTCRVGWIVIVHGCGRVGFDASQDASIDARDPSLVVRFDFEGTFEDAITGQMASCVAGGCPSFQAGKHGMAIELDGATACLQVQHELVPPFTVAAWLDDYTDTSYSIWAKPFVAGTPARDSWQLDTDTSRTLRFITYDGTIDQVAVASGAIVLDTWQHVAITDDGTTKDLYVGGTLVASTANGTIVDQGGQPVLLGCDLDATYDRFLAGRLDEVSMYSRALSATELAAIAAL